MCPGYAVVPGAAAAQPVPCGPRHRLEAGRVPCAERALVQGAARQPRPAGSLPARTFQPVAVVLFSNLSSLLVRNRCEG